MHGVVLAHRRAQEQRPLGAEAQLEAREEARAVVVEPAGAEPAGPHVAAPIDDDERVAAA